MNRSRPGFVLAGVMGATAIITGAQTTWKPVNLALPAGVLPDVVSACVDESGAPALRSVAAGVEAQCGLSGVARCTVPGTEPLDLNLASLCRGDAAAFTPATRAAIPSSARAGLTVEWREWRYHESTPLAIRRFDPAQPVPLPLGADERLLRVGRPAASPVTLVVAATAPGSPAEVPLELPAATPGGEVFLALGDRERQISSVTLTGPETRVVGVQGFTFVSVPGLTPGSYTLRFGSVDAPIGAPVSFVIRENATTELVPQLPGAADEFRITGVVTYNGKPMPSQVLDVVLTADDTTVTTTTNTQGRYSLTVPVEGVYMVRIESAYDFGQAEAEATVAKGLTTINLDVRGASVQLNFLVNGAAPDRPVEFVFEGAERISGIASEFHAPTELFAVPAGKYTVRASMPPSFVSTALPLEVLADGGMRTLTLDLMAQTATLRVVDAAGTPVEGARARLGTQLLRPIGTGEIDVSRMSPGAELIVRVRGLIPACHVLQAGVENVVVLGSDKAPLQIRYDAPNLTAPPGTIRFKDTDNCAVPLVEFDWTRIAGGFEIQNLPKDTIVTYEYGDQRIPLKAPGEVVVIK